MSKVTPVYGTNCIHDEDTMMNGHDTGIGGALFAYVPNVDNTVAYMDAHGGKNMSIKRMPFVASSMALGIHGALI